MLMTFEHSWCYHGFGTPGQIWASSGTIPNLARMSNEGLFQIRLWDFTSAIVYKFRVSKPIKDNLDLRNQ